MRKRFRKKLHSCTLCKPNKMGKECRWSVKETVLLKEFEKTKQYYR